MPERVLLTIIRRCSYNMVKNLVIVESPAKVKTVKKYLGSNYQVVASKGHVRDLPKSSMGIDVDHDYEPKYITIRGKGDILAELRKLSKEASRVYLATDPDREGEAISWHLAQALNLEPAKLKRITFNEITKTAVKDSLKNSREIDMDLVDAQQARRVLDRLVGYGISPILWEKVKRGLSAGRVQSVALRMICDRDQEIEDFVSEEFWQLDADIYLDKEKKPVTARFYGDSRHKIEIVSKEELDGILSKLEGQIMSVQDIKKTDRVKKAPLPFVTSTLQQEASKVLNFTTQKTMHVAQQLYEAGMITYLRTDSTRVSEEAVRTAHAYIEEHYGTEYASQAKPQENRKGKIQDAHEAIRPSDVQVAPDSVKNTNIRNILEYYGGADEEYFELKYAEPLMRMIGCCEGADIQGIFADYIDKGTLRLSGAIRYLEHDGAVSQCLNEVADRLNAEEEALNTQLSELLEQPCPEIGRASCRERV